MLVALFTWAEAPTSPEGEMWINTGAMANAFYEQGHAKAGAHLLDKHGLSDLAVHHWVSTGQVQRAKALAAHARAEVEYRLAQALSQSSPSTTGSVASAKSTPAGSWHSFGHDSVCRVDEADVSTDAQGTTIDEHVPSLEFCKQLCMELLTCTAVEYNHLIPTRSIPAPGLQHACRLWTQPVGFTRKGKGQECITVTRIRGDSEILHGFRPTFTHAMPTDLHPMYTDLGPNKCVGSHGQDPVYTYYQNRGQSCHRMCNENIACHGFSINKANNCLLWFEPGLQLGQQSWDGAHCVVKVHRPMMKVIRVTFTVEPNMMSYDAARAFCKSRGLIMASLHSGEEEHAARELAKSAGLDSVWIGAEPSSLDTWRWIDGTTFNHTRTTGQATNTSASDSKTTAALALPGDLSDRLSLRMTDHDWRTDSKAGDKAGVQHGVLCAIRGHASSTESVKTFQV